MIVPHPLSLPILAIFMSFTAIQVMAGDDASGQLPESPSSSRADSPTVSEKQNRVLHIPRVSDAPRLADYLQGARLEAARVADFRQRTPSDGKPVSQPTTAYLSYDDKNLYVLFDCQDDPKKIRRHLAKREDIEDDDRVSLILDTFHDKQTGYVFSVNPFGVQRDGIAREGQSTDYKFDTLWHSEARITNRGYVILITIPFKSVRFSGTVVQTWGIALGRTFVRNNETSYWPYITDRKAGTLPQAGDLKGIENISPSRNMTFIPYVNIAHARVLGPARYRSDQDYRGGMDSKIVFNNAFTLDTTINPDFSQVESDDPQVTINQRYEVYFPEKRPFFLENASLFSTPVRLFFSRRIVDPEFGSRLTGKVGNWSVGALATDDRAPGQTLSPSDPNYGNRAFDGVFRIQRDLGNQSRIGFLSTSRQFGSSWNRVLSIDARLHLSENWFFTGQIVRSYDRQRGGKKLTGPGYNLDLTRAGRHFTSSTSYSDLSPDFRAPLGFIKRVDVRTATHYMDYYWRPEGKRILDYGPSLTVSGNWDRTGRLTDRTVNAEFAVDMNGPIGFRVSRYDAYEYYLGTGFRPGRSGASFYVSWLRWILFYGAYGWGSGINYSPSEGLSPFLAKSEDASFGVTLKPTPRVTFTEFYYFSRLGQPVSPDSGEGLHRASVFNNHIARSKVNYQFTRALSLRAIIDYYSQLPNSSLINDVKFKQITGDVLLTYLLNPGTAVYLGYTSRYANVGEPGRPEYLPPVLTPATLTNRGLFVKLSYFYRP